VARCFRKELRRDIFAFATRTSSALVGFCLGSIEVLAFPAVGIVGNTGVCNIDARSIGCVVIGPGVGLILGTVDESFHPICSEAFDGTLLRNHSKNVSDFSSPAAPSFNSFSAR
jgi:hypothetical protein